MHPTCYPTGNTGVSGSGATRFRRVALLLPPADDSGRIILIGNSHTTHLAILGGSPIRTRSLPAWPVFDDEQIEAAIRVLRSGRVNYWTGEEGRAFEREFAEYCGRAHGVALANGTLALELALRALAIGPGAEVVVASRTFVATGSAVVTSGATPVFADVDYQSGNVTVDTIEAVVTPSTRAIIVVHVGGWPCAMDAIMEMARHRKLRVIEDCAQAHGASYKGRPVGSFGDAAAFSFCQDKIMTTAGEGGMLVLDDEDTWKRAWAYKDHGKNYDAVYHRHHPPGFRWLHDTIGTNWRLSEVQSALGRVALGNLDEWVAKRRENAALLDEGLRGVPGLRLHEPDDQSYHAYYRHYVSLAPEELARGWTRERVVDAIAAEGVPAFSGSCGEIYRENAFAGLRPPAPLPNAAALGRASLAFLVHPTLEAEDLEDTCSAIRKVMTVATRSDLPAPR